MQLKFENLIMHTAFSFEVLHTATFTPFDKASSINLRKIKDARRRLTNMEHLVIISLLYSYKWFDLTIHASSCKHENGFNKMTVRFTLLVLHAMQVAAAV